MNERVWASRALMDTKNVRGFDNDIRMTDRDAGIDAAKKNLDGIVLPRSAFPTKLFALDHKSKYKTMPIFMNSYRYLFVRSEFANILQNFDLGNGNLYPVETYWHDRKTLFEHTYFALNIGTAKNAIVVEQCKLYEPPAWQTYAVSPKRSPNGNLLDNELVVDQSALGGPDLWIDTQISSVLFMSDALVDALKVSKLSRHFGLRRCRLLQD